LLKSSVTLSYANPVTILGEARVGFAAKRSQGI